MRNIFEYRDGSLYRFKARTTASIGKPAGCQKARGYRYVMVNGKCLKEHRVIWEMFNGPIPNGLYIDHVDGNPSNNKIENLRLATPSQNMQNQVLRAKQKSTAIGVYERGKKWVAKITIRGVRYGLGTFSTYEEAVTARKIGESQHFTHAIAL